MCFPHEGSAFASLWDERLRFSDEMVTEDGGLFITSPKAVRISFTNGLEQGVSSQGVHKAVEKAPHERMVGTQGFEP